MRIKMDKFTEKVIQNLVERLLNRAEKLEKKIRGLEKRPYSVSCESLGITKDYPHETYPL